MPEWPHRIDADDISLTPVRTTISASPQERKDLARRMMVQSIESLEAKLVLKRDAKRGVVHVTGHFKTSLTQLCVVTLEPLLQKIDGAVEGWFADPDKVVSIARLRHEKLGRKRDTELPMLEEENAPEPFLNGQIDLGELVAQHVSLTIDPYPRKEGIVFGQEHSDVENTPVPEIRRNPFAALKNWKKGEIQEK